MHCSLSLPHPPYPSILGIVELCAALLKIMCAIFANYACYLHGYLLHCWYVNTKLILKLIQIYNSAQCRGGHCY